MNNTQLYDNTHLLNPKLMIGNISIHWKHDRNKCLGQKRKSLFPVPRLTLAQFPRLMTTFVLKTLSFSRSEKKKKGLPTNRPTLLFSTKEPEINFFFLPYQHGTGSHFLTQSHELPDFTQTGRHKVIKIIEIIFVFHLLSPLRADFNPFRPPEVDRHDS